MYGAQILFGPLGPEILLLVGLVVFLLGADRARTLANSVGESLGTVKKSRMEVEAELEEAQQEMTEIKQETEQEINEVVSETEQEIANAVGDRQTEKTNRAVSDTEK